MSNYARPQTEHQQSVVKQNHWYQRVVVTGLVADHELTFDLVEALWDKRLDLLVLYTAACSESIVRCGIGV